MKLTNIQQVESYDLDNQLLLLTFEGGKDSAYIIWNHADLIQHLNDDVIATFRKDMYNGSIVKFVNTLASVGRVHTLEREDNIKLYTDVTDTHANVLFRDIADGDTAMNAIVYVVDIRRDSSSRADWVDLTVMDRARKLAQLRLFSPDGDIADLKDRYIMCDIRHSKYGFSTNFLSTVDSAFPYNPEVEISERYILNAFAADTDILELLSDTKFLEFAKKTPDLEPGYLLVRLAVELDLASELPNLLGEVNADVVRRCLLLDKFCVFQQNSPYHTEIVSFATASKYQYAHKADVLLTLYSDDDAHKSERLLLKKVRELADSVIQVKKGLVK